MADRRVRVDISGNADDGLYVRRDSEGDFLLPQSLIDRLSAAEAELDAARQAIFDEIGVGSFKGLYRNLLERIVSDPLMSQSSRASAQLELDRTSVSP